jgi:opacity protein-like surface antigen
MGRARGFGWGAAASLAALALGAAAPAHADERLFVYGRGVDTLPQGEMEVALGTITMLDKDSGDYRRTEFRPEIEYGITDRLTVIGEMIFFDHDYSVDDPDLQPMFDTQGGAGGRFDEFQYGGFEISAKYNVLSVYQNPVGLSFGLGYEHREIYRLDGADIDQNTVVLRAFLQRNFLDDTLVFVLSPKVELERRTSPGVLEEEIGLDVAAGVSYRFAPNWNVGLEFRHQSDYLSPLDTETGEYEPALERSSWDLDDLRVGSQFQNGNYLGPVLHYSSRDWWVTAGALYQIAGGGNEEAGAYVRDGRDWDEHERWHIGLALGYEFGLGRERDRD